MSWEAAISLLNILNIFKLAGCRFASSKLIRFVGGPPTYIESFSTKFQWRLFVLPQIFYPSRSKRKKKFTLKSLSSWGGDNCKWKLRTLGNCTLSDHPRWKIEASDCNKQFTTWQREWLGLKSWKGQLETEEKSKIIVPQLFLFFTLIVGNLVSLFSTLSLLKVKRRSKVNLNRLSLVVDPYW